MAESPIISTAKLESMPWPTMDPFLFCVHHLDNYPAGDENMVPKADLSGRSLGSDFSGKNGFSMYHGQKIPGFPRHPHRGFETISIVRKGFIDHADSMGATARFGNGDVQWMTAGKGVVHSEMFPLVHTDKDNPTELFQIWINLPKADKFKEAYFTMFWQKSIPKVSQKGCQVTVVAGEYQGQKGPTPPPSSWASREDS